MPSFDGMEKWLLLYSAIAISVTGQVLLKLGASSSSFVQQLADWRSVLGLMSYGFAALLYMAALRSLPVSIALPSTAVSYVVVLIIGGLFLGEPVTRYHVACVAAIIAGVCGLTVKF